MLGRRLLSLIQRLVTPLSVIMVTFSAHASPNLCHHALLAKLSDLSAFNKKAWLTFADEIRKGSALGNIWLGLLGPGMVQMPKELRRQVLIVLGQDYSTLSKEEAISPPDGIRSSATPRQLVDDYMKYLLSAKDFFDQQLDQGTSVEETFIRYIDYVQGFVGSKGRYSGPHILQLIRTIQHQWLIKIKAEQSANTTEPQLLIGGSIPNGKGLIATSDFDANSNVGFSQTEVESMNIELKAVADTFFGRSGIYLSLNQFPLPLKFWLSRQPLLFRLRAQAIEILIYDPDPDKREDPHVIYRLELGPQHQIR